MDLISSWKVQKKKSEHMRYVYLRVTVDGIPKETSTKMKWDNRRWDQDLGKDGLYEELNK